MEQQIITNGKIMQAKTDIMDCIQAELSQGVPISALVLILESILPTLNSSLEATIRYENDELRKQEENQNEEIKEEEE